MRLISAIIFLSIFLSSILFQDVESATTRRRKRRRELTIEGLHIPHDLRRDDAFLILEKRRKILMKSMEQNGGDSTPSELASLERELREIDEKEEKLSSDIESDAKAWHEVHERRGALVDERIARLRRWKREGRKETMEEKKEFQKKLRLIERDEHDIRMNHFRASEEEREVIHVARDYLHDIQHDRQEAKKRGDTAEYQRLTPIMEEAHEKYIELMRPLHDREHDEL